MSLSGAAVAARASTADVAGVPDAPPGLCVCGVVDWEAMRNFGPLLVVLGLALAGVGALAWSGALSWFGRLPGDLRIESESTRVYVPITSMLLVSAALSAILWIAGRIFGR